MKVLVLSTSLKTKGGISTVIQNHTQMPFWNEYSCNLIETHIDETKWIKLLTYFKAILSFQLIFKYVTVHVHVGLE